MWSSDHNDCGWIIFEIKNNGDGHYGFPRGRKGCNMNVKGKVRYNKKYLYVGMVKLKFINKPEFNTNNDSVFLRIQNKKLKVIASMTLIETDIRGGNKYTFYKIKDY
jgi:hypothetical protein